MMTVRQTAAGTWAVLDDSGNTVREFATNAAAWRWYDEHEPHAVADENRRRRIAVAFPGQ